MSLKEVKIPEIGDYSDVDVIEINVSVGDDIAEEDSLLTLETDKASMEIPAPFAGKLHSLAIKLGEKVSAGDVIGMLDVASEEDALMPKSSSEKTVVEDVKEQAGSSSVQEIYVPAIGDYSSVDVIEVNVSVGDSIAEEDSLLTLETDKASMEIPSPVSGILHSLAIKVGDKVSQGDLIGEMKVGKNSETVLTVSTAEPMKAQKKEPKEANLLEAASQEEQENAALYASPAVRRLSHILGVDLSKITGTGDKGRITKEDCNAYLKEAVSVMQSSNVNMDAAGSGLNLLADPKVDFAKFGDITVEALTRINKLSAQNLHRNWVRIPHVTFHDDADMTDLEAFRKLKKGQAEKQKIKLTIMPFLLKAAAKALQAFPRMNSSLDETGESLVLKQYYHIGVAVDTPKGLIVPVIRDVDQKSIFEIAAEYTDLVERGRVGKIKPAEMQGGTFSISSLGILGTTGFTPIINMPEVAILGVSKSAIKPQYDSVTQTFVPRMMLPLSLSVDHRVIDGALAAKFLTYYMSLLSDLREILL